MTVPGLMHALTTAGIRLGLHLEVDAPAGALTGEIRAALIEHKPLLLVSLAREAQWATLRDLRWGPDDDWSNYRAEVDQLEADGLTRADALRHAYARRFKVDRGPIDPAGLAWLREEP
jgi:hypothetical protein